MVDALPPPRKKHPTRRTRVPTLPPMARSRAALFFTAYAARGELRLQHCEECGTVAYPPRDICGNCWSSALHWKPVAPDGVLLAETTLHTSTNIYFRERLPWRIGAVKLKNGPVVVAHIHSDAEEGAGVRIFARTDKSGQGVLFALPAEDTENMADDKALRELTCDPKHRRVLITDVRTRLGQSMARAALDAGAAKVFLGVAETWKPFQDQEALYALANTEIAPLDLADGASVAELASSIGGKVDILINTAQHIRPGSAMSRRDVVTAKEEMEVNFFGPLRLLQALGPAMRARGADGANSAVAWVNCLSVFALSNRPSFGLTSASQAAALSLSQNARSEFAGSGVKVINAFHGPLDDEWSQQLPPPKVAPERFATDVMRALRKGLEEVYFGEIAQDIHERWREDPAVLERELTLTNLMD